MHEPGQKIVREIKLRGAIPFSRFMELALYCPEYGYYEAEEDNLGREGDFFTSVSVGPLFGELLACQFARWLTEWSQTFPGPAKIAEAGAHDGTLARDILTALGQDQPGIFESVEYWLVEPSARRQQWQRGTLTKFGNKVRWAKNISELASAGHEGFSGILFANELLDAMPVHRLGWDAGRKEWFEWGVTFDEGRFTWARLSTVGAGAASLLPALPPALLDVLPDGFTTEVNAAAEEWWAEAARALSHGAVLTMDYGLTAEEFFQPHRAQGTLRSYRSHRLTPDPLADPGKQDITAHVNFSEIQRTGERAGLGTAAFLSQSQFLTHILQQLWSRSPAELSWDTARTRQFRTLIDPAGLGRFKVLIQTRGAFSFPASEAALILPARP